MRRVFLLCAILLAFAVAGIAQLGRTTDWWTYAGDSQRTGWEKNEQRFTKEDVKNFQLLWKEKLDNERAGVDAILPPVVLGLLIGYRGFKELAFVAGSNDNLWAIDADLDRLYWRKHFPDTEALPRSPRSSCGATLSAMPALPAPIVFGRKHRVRAHAASSRPMPNIFSVRPVYLLTSDGKLHQLNQADGSDLSEPIPFIPPGSPAQNLNITDDSIYATTGNGCNGQPSAVWSLDLEDTTDKPESFLVNGAQIRGLGGAALGTDGGVYVQTGDGKFDPSAQDFANTLLSLTSDDLKLKDYFVLPGAGSTKGDLDMNVTTPVVFGYKGRDLVVTTGKDGRLYLLDSKSLGGADHRTPLFRTVRLSAGDGTSPLHGVWGSLSSWENESGVRYVLAAVWGPRSPELTAPVSHGETPDGFIVAFQLHDQEGHLSLIPAWISRDMAAPAPPVIAKDVVFALANGAYVRKVKRSHGKWMLAQHPQHGAHATLYAFDGATGEEMYSTADQVLEPGNLSGLSIANGRLYFATTGNTLYAFGKYLEH